MTIFVHLWRLNLKFVKRTESQNISFQFLRKRAFCCYIVSESKQSSGKESLCNFVHFPVTFCNINWRNEQRQKSIRRNEKVRPSKTQPSDAEEVPLFHICGFLHERIHVQTRVLLLLLYCFCTRKQWCKGTFQRSTPRISDGRRGWWFMGTNPMGTVGRTSTLIIYISTFPVNSLHFQYLAKLFISLFCEISFRGEEELAKVPTPKFSLTTEK